MEMTSRLLTVACLVAVCACHKKKDEAVLADVKGCGERPQKDCGPLGCGPNSPISNTFPINGLTNDADGACNMDLVQLMPHSLSGAGDCDHADLVFDVAKKVLVGKKGDDVVCSGDQLIDATFKVRGPLRTIELKIKKRRATKVKPHEVSFEGYRIVYKDKHVGSDEDPKGSTCDPDVAAEIRADLGLKPLPQYTASNIPAPTNGPNSELVIGVNEPIYTVQNRPFQTSGHMFNLACADDALGKRSTYDLVTSDVQKNTDALRMLTATYCDKPYTVRGMDIAWNRDQDTEEKKHEAAWDGGGTKCIDIPRLTYLKDARGNTIEPDNFPEELKPPGCGSGAHCTIDDWKAKVLAECGGGSGSGGSGSGSDASGSATTPASSCDPADKADLQSFAYTKGNHIMFVRKSDAAKGNMQTGSAAQ